MSALNRVDCSICQMPLDGKASPDVICSERCFHLFHRHCIEPWLEHDFRCPECRLFALRKVELIDYPEISKVYQKCLREPNLCSDDKRLRPESLRNMPRKYDKLTAKELRAFTEELETAAGEAEAILADPNATLEQKETAKSRLDRLRADFEQVQRQMNPALHLWLDEMDEQIGKLEEQNERWFEKMKKLTADIEKLSREFKEDIERERRKIVEDRKKMDATDKELSKYNILFDTKQVKPSQKPTFPRSTQAQPKPIPRPSENLFKYGFIGLAIAAVYQTLSSFYFWVCSFFKSNA